jgi:alkylation response protein AidB-like acyl-CoA dehydrogenase
MRFQLTEDQRALRDGVRGLLARRFDRTALRAAVDRPGRLDRALWRELGAAGFFALRLPEADGGVGLGLAVAKGFAEGMGGTIAAADTPGGGLTIRVTLPVTSSGARTAAGAEQ